MFDVRLETNRSIGLLKVVARVLLDHAEADHTTVLEIYCPLRSEALGPLVVCARVCVCMCVLVWTRGLKTFAKVRGHRFQQKRKGKRRDSAHGT